MKNKQRPKRGCWLKGSSGVLGLAVWQVLRLRRSQSARPAPLRMTELWWGGDFMPGLWPSGFVAVLTQGFSTPTSKSARRGPRFSLGWDVVAPLALRVGISAGRCGDADTPISKCERSGAPGRLPAIAGGQIQGSLHCPFGFAQGPVEMTELWDVKNKQRPKRGCWLNGSSGVLGLAVWQVLRLRASPFAQDDRVGVGFEM